MSPRVCAVAALAAIVLIGGLAIVSLQPADTSPAPAPAATCPCGGNCCPQATSPATPSAADCQKRDRAAHRHALLPWNGRAKCPKEEVNVSVTVPSSATSPAVAPLPVTPQRPRFPYGVLAVVVILTLLVSAPVAFVVRMRGSPPAGSS
jgi:hypothetical protein